MQEPGINIGQFLSGGPLRFNWPIISRSSLCLGLRWIRHTCTLKLIYPCLFLGSYYSYPSNKTKKTWSCVFGFHVISLRPQASPESSTCRSFVGKNACPYLTTSVSWNNCSKIIKPMALNSQKHVQQDLLQTPSLVFFFSEWQTAVNHVRHIALAVKSLRLAPCRNHMSVTPS